MQSALIFDIDSTLTPPRLPLRPEMALALSALAHPFYVDAGSDLPLVREQFLQPLADAGFSGTFDAFLCNGAIRYRCRYNDDLDIELTDDFSLRDALGIDSWQDLLSAIEHLLTVQFPLPESVPVLGETIIDRGAMLNVAPNGRPEEGMSERAHACRVAFVEYDKSNKYREQFLQAFQAHCAKTAGLEQIEACLGGQTSFDIGFTGRNKSLAVARLLSEGVDQIVYFGDALHPGGNDEAVMHYVRAQQLTNVYPIEVESWNDTLGHLHAIQSQGIGAWLANAPVKQ